MARAVLYQDYNFQGRQKEVKEPISFLQDFNDVASSIVVLEGVWQLYTDANYQNLVATLSPGVYPSVDQIGLPNDTLSSLRSI
jgi:hypothetical protein